MPTAPSVRRATRPRRGLNLAEAAFYVGVTTDKFKAMMADGRMPRPKLIDAQRVFDLEMLDVYFVALPDDQRDDRALSPAGRAAARREAFNPDRSSNPRS